MLFSIREAVDRVINIPFCCDCNIVCVIFDTQLSEYLSLGRDFCPWKPSKPVTFKKAELDVLGILSYFI